MKIVVAKSAGFCFGVQRAVDLVMNAVEKYEGQKIYTYGPIIPMSSPHFPPCIISHTKKSVSS